MTSFEAIRLARMIHGFMSSDEQAEFMFNLAKVTTKAAELGAYYGLSAAIVGQGMRDRGKYYCVDAWAATKNKSSPELSCPATKIQFLRNMMDFGLTDTCIPVTGWSYDPETLAAVPDDLDWIYVDADHTVESLARDLKLWVPKVQVGGLVLFHDATWESVRAGIDYGVGQGWFERVNMFDDFAICRRTKAD